MFVITHMPICASLCVCVCDLCANTHRIGGAAYSGHKERSSRNMAKCYAPNMASSSRFSRLLFDILPFLGTVREVEEEKRGEGSVRGR